MDCNLRCRHFLAEVSKKKKSIVEDYILCWSKTTNPGELSCDYSKNQATHILLYYIYIFKITCGGEKNLFVHMFVLY